MKKFAVRVALPLLLSFVCGLSQAEMYYQNKNVDRVHSPDSRPCTFFTLTGVAVADPVVPDNPWFGVPKTHEGYKEIIASLMMAKATGQPLLLVVTSGTLACGQATVHYVTY